jgi:hypothetical protein
MALTGRFSFRRTLLGKVALVVEEEKAGPWPLSRGGRTRKYWRDASLIDLTHHELRKILEVKDEISSSVEQVSGVESRNSSNAVGEIHRRIEDAIALVSNGR